LIRKNKGMKRKPAHNMTLNLIAGFVRKTKLTARNSGIVARQESSSEIGN